MYVILLLLLIVAAIGIPFLLCQDAGGEGADDPTMPFWKNKMLSVPAVLLMLFFLMFGGTVPGEGKVWSENRGCYVPDPGPLAVTNEEGGLGGGGILFVLVVLGGAIYAYMEMNKPRRPPGGPWDIENQYPGGRPGY